MNQTGDDGVSAGRERGRGGNKSNVIRRCADTRAWVNDCNGGTGFEDRGLAIGVYQGPQDDRDLPGFIGSEGA